MEFYFKEHKDQPLVTKGFVTGATGHVVFEIQNGVALIEDVPDIDPALTGKAARRAAKRRQGAIEAIHEAIRELGGVPAPAKKVKAEAIKAGPQTEKSGKGGKG